MLDQESTMEVSSCLVIIIRFRCFNSYYFDLCTSIDRIWHLSPFGSQHFPVSINFYRPEDINSVEWDNFEPIYR